MFIRDGTDNLCLPRNLKNYNTTLYTIKNNNNPTSCKVSNNSNAKLKFKCKYCLHDFAGLQLHLKKNPICRLKHEEWSNHLGK